MSIGSLPLLSSGVLQPPVKPARLQSAIDKMVSQSGTLADVTDVTGGAQLQAQISGLRTLSGNLAQGLTQAQVADQGLGQIEDTLGQLQSLSSDASSSAISADTRQKLDTQFQNALSKLGQIVSNTRFNGSPLLNGALSGDNALSLDSLLSDSTADSGGVSIMDLSPASLLGNDLSLISTESAGNAFAIVNSALQTVGQLRTSLASYRNSVGFAAASVDSAAANYLAAQSSAGYDGQNPIPNYNAEDALYAQRTKLNPALLQLIS